MEPQTETGEPGRRLADEVTATEDECVAILDDFRAFLDDPVALLERALELVHGRTTARA